MRRFDTVARDVGRILEVLAVVVLGTVPVALLAGEFYVLPSLLVSALVPLLLGRGAHRRYADAPEPGKLHGMVVAAFGWLAVALFGSLPFVLIAWTVALDPPLLSAPAGTETLAAFRNPINAVFESMSGFTGTGLTMTDREPALPTTLQWWRSLTQWVGGVGVIVLTTAVLARPGSGSLTLYESEARSEKIHPSIVSTVRTIWWIFVLFTLAAVLVLWLAGLPLWQALNHAMTGLATGGYSVTDASIASHDSVLVDAALIPIMIAGSIAFPVHYLMFKGELRNVYADLQTRWLAGYAGGGALALTAVLHWLGPYDTLAGALRYGGFQFVSAATCTGFQTAAGVTTVPLGEWPALAQLTVAGAMVVGGAAGSTAGGIKIIRLATLVAGARFTVVDAFYPDSALRRLEINGRRLDETAVSNEFTEAAIVGLLWVGFLLAAIVVFLTIFGDQYGLANVVFEVASAQGNVGLSAGITGPDMPTAAKLTFLGTMWIGRLEIIPVLVGLRVLFSRGGFYR